MLHRHYIGAMSHNIDFEKINKPAVAVCLELQRAGYQSYIVGGCVRDLLLGTEPKDWDITTDALPEVVAKMFPKVLLTGLQHGTVTVMLDGEPLEVTTFRTEGTYTDGRRPDSVEFVKSLVEDLSRRDLTINAMALDPMTMILNDPFGGLDDLKNGIIKAVGDPMLRFAEDGLRILRVARFSARFGYKVDVNTVYGMGNSRHNLKSVSKERIKDELVKILKSPNTQLGINQLIKTNVLEFVSERLHSHSVTGALRHMLPSIQKYQGDWETKLALLFFPSSNEEIDRYLRELTFSNAEIKKVLYLNSNIEKYYNKYKGLALGDIKSFIAHLKNTAIDENSYGEFCKYCLALECTFCDDHIALMNITIPLRKEMQINGNDLIGAGFAPGPAIKTALDSAYEVIIQQPKCNNKEYLLNFCLTLK